ncbi:SWR1-complex protein 5 [[Candida] railenensis]|uniref:SWR1-complex protein 5 n=1 Tax=[Candida] railenensis TaxID=45579 RepID=A0A9P0QLR7_9ASCO|nr:SWR1-complex protein 5 [[Candida] railenensis]
MAKKPVSIAKAGDHAEEGRAKALDENGNENEEDSYDEDEDEDYEPSAKKTDDDNKKEVADEDEEDDSDEDSNDKKLDDEPIPDFSAIESGGERLVKTRRQRQEEEETNNGRNVPVGLVRGNKYSSIDVDELFNSLKQESARGGVISPETPTSTEQQATHAGRSNRQTAPSTKGTENKPGHISAGSNGGPEMITIESSYTFAGKVITETKQVEVGSAEAKAYMNSTGNIAYTGERSAKKEQRSFVPIVREVNGEHLELRIKLKRPSLIDKFLLIQGNKSQKLSTLEKSRLDWASFVDKRKLQDDLKLHNKDGYLDKQDFLNRVESKKDQQYKQAQEEDRKNRLNEGNN